MGTVRSFLKRDHARLEGLHARLLDGVRSEHGAERRVLWRRFEVGLLDHMAAEERYLLRQFGRRHGAEAAALRAQHADFRKALAQLGSDPGCLEELERLIGAVCEHGRLEDGLLYRWAEGELEDGLQERIARELARKDRDTTFGRRE